MKQTMIAACLSAVITSIGVSSTWAQGLVPVTPSAVEGQGVYQHFFAEAPWGEWYPSDEEVGQFVIRVTPDPTGKKACQAVIHVNGKAFKAFWGKALVLRGDLAENYGLFWSADDPKPGQVFVFKLTHPTLLTEVAVCVYIHDNGTHGYNAENPQLSDWFGIYVEPWEGGNRLPNGAPAAPDDMFTTMGIVTNGDIMDYRE